MGLSMPFEKLSARGIMGSIWGAGACMPSDDTKRDLSRCGRSGLATRPWRARGTKEQPRHDRSFWSKATGRLTLGQHHHTSFRSFRSWSSAPLGVVRSFNSLLRIVDLLFTLRRINMKIALTLLAASALAQGFAIDFKAPNGVAKRAASSTAVAAPAAGLPTPPVGPPAPP